MSALKTFAATGVSVSPAPISALGGCVGGGRVASMEVGATAETTRAYIPHAAQGFIRGIVAAVVVVVVVAIVARVVLLLVVVAVIVVAAPSIQECGLRRLHC